MFDLSLPKLLVLAVIALVIFGPNELPKIAAQAGRALRDLRKIADSVKNDLRDGLGPEFASGIEDLNPKRFAHKHLLGNANGDPDPKAAAGDRARAVGVLDGRAIEQPERQAAGADAGGGGAADPAADQRGHHARHPRSGGGEDHGRPGGGDAVRGAVRRDTLDVSVRLVTDARVAR
jgi:sec-independent protein translocase protein TatB